MRKFLILLVLLLAACENVTSNEDDQYVVRESIDLDNDGVIELGESLFVDDFSLTLMSSEVKDAEEMILFDWDKEIEVIVHFRNFAGDNLHYWIYPSAFKNSNIDDKIFIESPDGEKLETYYQTDFYYQKPMLETAGIFTKLLIEYVEDGTYIFSIQGEQLYIDVLEGEILSGSSDLNYFVDFEYISGLNPDSLDFHESFDRLGKEILFKEVMVGEQIEILAEVTNRRENKTMFIDGDLNFYGPRGLLMDYKVIVNNVELNHSIDLEPNQTVEVIFLIENIGVGNYSICSDTNFDDYYFKVSFDVGGDHE